MLKNRKNFGLAALMVTFLAGISAPALAEIPNGQARHVQATVEDFAAQTQHRPHIVIRPRRIEPGPNAKRHCRSWLAEEYRVSGPVIVPQMHCWWE